MSVAKSEHGKRSASLSLLMICSAECRFLAMIAYLQIRPFYENTRIKNGLNNGGLITEEWWSEKENIKIYQS